MSKILTHTGSSEAFSRTPRIAGFLVITVVHIIVILVLVTQVVDVVDLSPPELMQTRVVIEPSVPVSLPANPTPEFKTPTSVALPDIKIATPSDNNAISTDVPDGVGGTAFTPPEEWRISKPVYPAAARRGEQEGVVMLLLYIDEEGRVRNAKIEKSSGFTLLDEAAYRQALKGWRFKPARKNGVPYAVWHSVFRSSLC